MLTIFLNSIKQEENELLHEIHDTYYVFADPITIMNKTNVRIHTHYLPINL